MSCGKRPQECRVYKVAGQLWPFWNGLLVGLLDRSKCAPFFWRGRSISKYGHLEWDPWCGPPFGGQTTRNFGHTKTMKKHPMELSEMHVVDAWFLRMCFLLEANCTSQKTFFFSKCTSLHLYIWVSATCGTSTQRKKGPRARFHFLVK